MSTSNPESLTTLLSTLSLPPLLPAPENTHSLTNPSPLTRPLDIGRLYLASLLHTFVPASTPLQAYSAIVWPGNVDNGDLAIILPRLYGSNYVKAGDKKEGWGVVAFGLVEKFQENPCPLFELPFSDGTVHLRLMFHPPTLFQLLIPYIASRGVFYGAGILPPSLSASPPEEIRTEPLPEEAIEKETKVVEGEPQGPPETATSTEIAVTEGEPQGSLELATTTEAETVPNSETTESLAIPEPALAIEPTTEQPTPLASPLPPHLSQAQATQTQSPPTRKRIILEFSSPNLATPFATRHLRSTLIGIFLSNLYESFGYEVHKINYLGDWGKDLALLGVGYAKFHGNGGGGEDGAVEEGVVGDGVVGDGVVAEAVVGETVGEAVVGEAVVEEAVLEEAVLGDGVVGDGVVEDVVLGDGVVGEIVAGEPSTEPSTVLSTEEPAPDLFTEPPTETLTTESSTGPPRKETSTEPSTELSTTESSTEPPREETPTELSTEPSSEEPATDLSTEESATDLSTEPPTETLTTESSTESPREEPSIEPSTTDSPTDPSTSAPKLAPETTPETNLQENDITQKQLTAIYTRILAAFAPEVARSKKARDDKTGEEAIIESQGLFKERNEWFAHLEEGRLAEITFWKSVRQNFVSHYEELYSKLGVNFDEYTGESAVRAEIMVEVERVLKGKGVLEEDVATGSWVVDLKKHGGGRKGMCIIRDRSGSSTYLLRDLAAVVERKREWKDRGGWEKMVYVVQGGDGGHVVHFQRIVRLLELMGMGELAGRLLHVVFGDVGGVEEIVEVDDEGLLESVLAKCKNGVQATFDADPEKRGVFGEGIDLEILGVNTLLAQELTWRRTTDYKFDLGKMSSFDGGTGLHLHYWYTKLCDLLKENDGLAGLNLEDGEEELEDEDQNNLLRWLVQYPDVTLSAFTTLESAPVVKYLFDVIQQLEYCLEVKDEGEDQDGEVAEDGVRTTEGVEEKAEGVEEKPGGEEAKTEVEEKIEAVAAKIESVEEQTKGGEEKIEVAEDKMDVVDVVEENSEEVAEPVEAVAKNPLSKAEIKLYKATKVVLENGMNLLGLRGVER